MNNFSRRYIKYVLYLVVIIFTFSLAQWMGNGKFIKTGIAEAKITKATIGLNKANPKIKEVMAIQNSHTPDLMALPEVVGTATGLTDAGGIAILVFTENRVEAGVIPRSLEGIPVVVKVTGKILAFKKPSWAGPGGGSTSNNIDPTGRFNRPVPIGVSTGNEGECSAGTIGARVKKGSEVYALSNNHVYALENNAEPDSEVLQPGLYDTNCIYDSNNHLGQLNEYNEIKFGGTNTIDAAIALTTTGVLGNATPSDGYGKPNSVTTSAEIDQNVQKYGRTTSLTKGIVTAINATVNVGYSSGTALFTDQIVVTGNKGPFIKAGDSGSLLVTDDSNCKPVGLLFAGNSSGKTAIANPIDYVLNYFGVTIDGK